ncbi:hypothetical protein ACFJI1_08440 [Pseudoxanthomonas sp. UC29_72]
MSQQTTIRKLAELVNTPVDKLIEQLAEAGMKFSGPDAGSVQHRKDEAARLPASHPRQGRR